MLNRSLQDFSRQVVEIMPQIYREFAKREDNELMTGKISFPQMVTLQYVSNKKCVNMKCIANNLGIKMSSASTLVDRLIREKMLSRRHDEKDRRIVWISMTSKGTKVIRHILDQKQRSTREIFSVLTERERQQYLGLLKKAYLQQLKHEKFNK